MGIFIFIRIEKPLILSFTKKEAKLNVFRPLFYIFSRIKILTPQPYQQFFQYPHGSTLFHTLNS